MKSRVTPKTAAQALNLTTRAEGASAFRVHEATFIHFSRSNPKWEEGLRVAE